MSRTPIRSALQRLQQEGYIVAVGSGRLRRTVVAPLTREDALELFEIVAALEGVAARTAATLEPAARDAVVARMRGLSAELRAISEGGAPDPAQRFENDIAFHRSYVELAGKRLRALHDAVKPQAERYIRAYVSLLVRTSTAEHEAIVDALASGDPDGAQRAVEANWRNAAGRLARVIEQLGEKGNW